MIDPSEDPSRRNAAADPKWVTTADPRFKDRIIGARGGYGPKQERCSKCKARVHLADIAVAYAQEHPDIPIVCYRCSKADLPVKILPTWFIRLPQIIEHIEAIDKQAFDRDSIGILFDLQRSGAAKLLAELGADKVAGRYTISRKMLLLKLHRMQKIGSFKEAAAREEERRQKLSDKIRAAKEEHKARSVQIPVKPESRHKKLDELDGTTLEPGKITITFETPDQFLVRIMELGYALSDDYEEFCHRVAVVTDKFGVA